MRVLPRALVLVAGLHFLLLSATPLARAQPAEPVQPVPYPNAPIPYAPSAPLAQAAPDVPPAAPLGQDVIRMKNGGLLRGTIIDAIPGAQARIQLATGEIATVPWEEVSGIEHAGAVAAPSTSTGPALPRPSAPPPSPKPPRSNAIVWVHIEGSDSAHLEMDRYGDGTWQTACRSPCDIALPVAADYRIAGGMIRKSATFQLHGNHGDHVTITVNGGSVGWLVVGIVIVPIAGLVTLVAAMVGLAGSAVASTPNNPGTVGARPANAASIATTGWVTAAIGAAVTLGGILLVANNSKTTVGVESSTAPPPDAWVRTPTWHETAQERETPPVLGVPLLSGHF